MTESIAARDDSSYLSFLQGLGSVIIGLKRCSADLDRTRYYELMDKRKKDRKRVIDGDYRLDKVTETYFDVSATVSVAVRDRKDDSNALSIECTYEGHFHGEPPVQRGLAERFVKSQLRVVLWPYVRQFVSDTTARMSINPVFLPFYLGTGQEKPAETPQLAVIAERPVHRRPVRRKRRALKEGSVRS